MNPSNSTEADPGLLPTSSTHPGSRPDLSRPEPMSNDEMSDSDVSFDEDDDDEDMHDTSGHSLNDELAVQLALAGPTGVAAAAAISSTKKAKKTPRFRNKSINSEKAANSTSKKTQTKH